jgi:1-phosphofructokinase family hexose kinase
LCLGFLGGQSGKLVAELTEREGLPAHWTWIEGETRTCIIIAEENGHEATVINESGPNVTAEEWAALTADSVREAATAQIVCVSGSLPSNPSVESFTVLLGALCATRKPVWVDTSGPALAAALTVAGIHIKVNDEEIGALLNQPVPTAETAQTAAQALQAHGVQNAIITLGKEGAVLVSEAGAWHARPPAIRVVSAVGSGDSFLAGWATALTHQHSHGEALRWAVAAGAANALAPGGGQFALSDFTRLLGETTLTSI